MNGTSRVTLGWPALIAGAVVLLGVGAGLAYLTVRPPSQNTTVQQPSASAPPAAASGSPSPAAVPPGGSAPDVVVTLTPEATQRAGVVLATVTEGRADSALRLPGVVEANAYKQVAVTPVVGGRVTRVLAQLGQSVRAGQPLAEVFSPEVAEAETRFVSALAELDAHERELARTEKLVEIGSASRQELERLHAEHTAKLSALESARSRLQLLGLPAAAISVLGPGKDVSALATVPAPIAGVITERTANAGLNVETTSKLFTVVDLSTVWVVADAYEKDFARVHVGASARINTSAFPDAVLSGRVSYIDPQMNAETRTAKIRVEVSNPRQVLRLGMFADVTIDAGNENTAALIPRTAIQNVGNRTVVYLADAKQPGRFLEREVVLGARGGNDVAVLRGVQPGDTVVADGSFAIRAERDRLGLRGSESSAPVTANAPPASTATGVAAGAQEAKVLVTEKGFEPAKLAVRAGEAARITFVRTTDKTCGTDVVFPSLGIRRFLPLNEPVVIEFTPRDSGEIGFVCGMNMLRGTVVVH
ncbi:MAG TPA: efflux RND transporter periplasmic adaptor subunit [Vicinamibacterales bacterium]|nr:efflux RND transporter periplasmic adaptor subunit [Vicinamibacterales bacterium]